MSSRIDAVIAALGRGAFGVFTRRDAALAGISRAALGRRIRSGSLAEPVAGVLVHRSHSNSFDQRLAIAVRAAGSAPVVSHRAAARLRGLDGFADAPLEVTVPPGGKCRMSNVVVHQSVVDSRDRVRIRGHPVTSIARTLCDLGAVCSTDLVERALDDARRRGTSLRWLEDTAVRTHRRGPTGTKTLLELLGAAVAPVRGSWFERLVELALADPSLPEVHRQYVVRDVAGRFVARVDLAIPAVRLAIEAHSRRWHEGRRAELHDETRDHRLAACGWLVVYVGWRATVESPDQVLQVVREAVGVRLTQLGQLGN